MKLVIIVALILLWASLAFADCDLKVHRIIDGDTFHAFTLTVFAPKTLVLQESGFRMARVYTPERKEPDYEKAKKDLTDLIGDKYVEIQFAIKSAKKTEVYGRWLVEVFTCDGDKKINVNDQMREKGWTVSGRGLPKK